MDAARWKRVWKLFDAVAEVAPQGREEALRSMEPDPRIRDEVQSLLAADEAGPVTAEPAPEIPPMLAPGTLVGPWRIESLLGRGGMGEVYLVTRTGADFEQRAALKLMLRMESQEDRARFDAERRILARLEHPSIARLLDGSEYEGTPYAVMEYFDGQPLTGYARGLPLRERLELMQQACEAVGHAHRHMVVHRDLKPGNILVNAEGQLKLLDFGIAKRLSPDPDAPANATQVIRASPDYCAPEQLDGSGISTATDVYALGAILFELLTGERPWQLGGVPFMQALERLSLQDPPRPSSRVRGAAARALRGDLDNIVVKALQPAPEQRYRTTDELAADIRAHLEQRPVKARKPTLRYVLVRAFSRHRLAFALAGVAAISMVAGVTGVIGKAREAAIERDHAQREVERNNAVRQYMTLMFRAAGELQGEDALTARDVLSRAADQMGDQFSSDPVAHADISLALAELFFQINDYTGARPLLERLVDETAPIAPDVRAMARHDLAQVNLRESRQHEASELLQQAQAFWAAEPARYRSELLDSRLLQSQVERARGDVEQGLQTLEDALPERIALSGEQHRETAVLINNLGNAYFQAGRLDDAVLHFQRSHEAWKQLGQDRSADALNTLNNWAAVEALLQRPQKAVDLMRQALDLRQDLYGPSAAMAALLNNLGKTLSQLEHHGEAIPLLRQAVKMAQIHAGGESSMIALSAQLGLADALSGTGKPAQALEIVDATTALILEAHGSEHPLAAIAGLSRARAQYSAGEIQAARSSLTQTRTDLEALGPAGQRALSQVQLLEERWYGPSAGVATATAGAGSQPVASE